MVNYQTLLGHFNFLIIPSITEFILSFIPQIRSSILRLLVATYDKKCLTVETLCWSHRPPQIITNLGLF